MGLFGGSAGSSKVDLVRSLLAQRIASDAAARVNGFTPEMVMSVSEVQLMGTIEAAIVTIAESYQTLTEQGVAPVDALKAIEAHRRRLGSGVLPVPLQLMGYVEYRVALENDGAELPEDHALLCVHAAMHFYATSQPKGEATHSLTHAMLELKNQEVEGMVNVLSSFFKGLITNEDLKDILQERVAFLRSRDY